jgi:hypothetical protein
MVAGPAALMNSHALATFRKLRRAGYSAAFAADYARTLDAFRDAENEGRARIRFAPDESSTLRDNYDESAYQDRAGRALWKRFEQQQEREGWHGAIAEIRREPAETSRWADGEEDRDAEDVDSLWGLLGDNFRDDDPRGALALEYRLDMMKACLARLADIDAENEQQTNDVETVRRELRGTVEVWEDAEHARARAAREALAAFERIAKRLAERDA